MHRVVACDGSLGWQRRSRRVVARSNDESHPDDRRAVATTRRLDRRWSKHTSMYGDLSTGRSERKTRGRGGHDFFHMRDASRSVLWTGMRSHDPRAGRGHTHTHTLRIHRPSVQTPVSSMAVRLPGGVRTLPYFGLNCTLRTNLPCINSPARRRLDLESMRDSSTRDLI